MMSTNSNSNRSSMQSSSNSRPANAWARPLRSTNPSTNANDSSSITTSGLSHLSLHQKTNGSNNNNSTGLINSNSMTDVLRERFLHLYLSLIGHNVTLTLVDGSILEGVLHTFTPFEYMKHDKNKYVIKACKLVSKGNTDKSDSVTTTIGEFENGSTVIIPSYKVSQMLAKSVRLETNVNPLNSNNDANQNDPFRTDTDISRITSNRNKTDDLVFAGSAWTTPNSDSNHNSLLDGAAGLDDNLQSISSASSSTNNNSSLSSGRKGLFGTAYKKQTTPTNPNNSTNTNSSGELTGGIGKWDQFTANEHKFGVKASFDENLYTTSLDKSTIDEKKRLEAERIAREIEGSATTNLHLAEERGHKIEGDFDEEDLYSGVLVQENTKDRVKLKLQPRTIGLEEKKDVGNVTTSKSSESTPPVVSSSSTSETTAPVVATTTSKQSDNTPSQTPTTASAESINASNKAPSSPPKKVMNYAAAAKAHVGNNSLTTANTSKTALTNQDVKKLAEPKSTPEETNQESSMLSTKGNDEAESRKEEVKSEKENTADDKKNSSTESSPDADIQNDENKESDDNTKTEDKPKVTSKLNANAKAFTFNPSAKSFTPSFGTSAAAAPTSVPPKSTPSPIPEYQYGMSMPPQGHYAYMQHGGMPIGAPMMPYQGYHAGVAVRFQGNPYGMMQQGYPTATISAQNQDVQNPAHAAATAQENHANTDENEGDEDQGSNIEVVEGSEVEESTFEDNADKGDELDDTPQDQQQLPQQQQQQGPQQLPPYYGMPRPMSYYPTPGMMMHPGGGRGMTPQHYHQMGNAGPQHMPVSNYPMYGVSPNHMHQAGAPYNQMRAGGYPGAPYVQVGYGAPGQGMEDDMMYRGGRGGRGGRGNNNNRRGGRKIGGRGGNMGRGNYQNPYQGNSNQQGYPGYHVGADEYSIEAAVEPADESQTVEEGIPESDK